MNIGKLRNKVELQNYTTSADSVGQPTKTWTTFATVWAHIKPMSGREVITAEQPIGETTHTITIRYNSSIDESSRIRYYDNVKGVYRIFDINYIGDRDEKNEMMTLVCKEKTT
jgi:SPP1 family predicted phage head-tail adaptor